MHFVEGGNRERRLCERTVFKEKYSLHRKAMLKKVYLTITAPIKT
jgi:hypothetical protein